MTSLRIFHKHLKVQNSFNKFFIPQFTLETGEILKEVEIAYSTYGKLSKDGKNGVLIFHALTGSQLLSGNFSSEDFPEIPWNEELETGWWDEFVGPNKIIDTNKYFVVCANYLGGCYGSTGPNSKNSTTGDTYGYDFPHISFKDIEESKITPRPYWSHPFRGCNWTFYWRVNGS